MMKMIAMLGLVLSASAFASSDMTSQMSTSSMVNNTVGHWSISTSNITAGFNDIDNGSIAISPQVEYFVLDQISLGLATNFTTAYSDKVDTQYGVSAGPSATWHFWSKEQLSALVGANWMFNNLLSNSTASFSDRVTNTLGFTVGANYNFASWFGVGPQLKWNINNVTNQARNSDVSADVALYFYL